MSRSWGRKRPWRGGGMNGEEKVIVPCITLMTELTFLMNN